MPSRKYLRAVARLENQCPEPPPHERGQPVLKEATDQTRSDVIKLVHTVDGAGNLRLVRAPQQEESH